MFEQKIIRHFRCALEIFWVKNKSCQTLMVQTASNSSVALGSAQAGTSCQHLVQRSTAACNKQLWVRAPQISAIAGYLPSQDYSVIFIALLRHCECINQYHSIVAIRQHGPNQAWSVFLIRFGTFSLQPSRDCQTSAAQALHEVP